MKRSPSPKDIKALSSYLDNQLSESKKKRLELRLEQEKALRIAFEDLRLTRAALRQAPQAKVPHNFVLTPEMVKVHQKSFGPYPAMRLISSIASILFVIVFVGDFINSSSLLVNKVSEELSFSVADAVEAEAGAAMAVELDDAESIEIASEVGESERVPLEVPSALAAEDANAETAPAESVEGDEPAADTAIIEEEVGAAPIPTAEKNVDEPSAEVQDIEVETYSDQTNNIEETPQIVDADQNRSISENEVFEEIPSNKLQYSQIIGMIKWFLAILAIVTGLLTYLLGRR